MVDLKLNERGDLSVQTQSERSRFNVTFMMSKYPAFKIIWKQGDGSGIEQPENSIEVSFFADVSPEYDEVQLLRDNNELKQRIWILLRTELKDLKNRADFGTELIRAKHFDVTQNSTLTTVKEIVLDAVSGLLSNPSVEVKRRHGSGVFDIHNLTVFIMDDGVPVFDFDLSEVD